MVAAASKYFSHDPKTKRVTFVGEELIIYIPRRYDRYGCLEVTEEVKTLAIFEMVINGSIEVGYYLPAHIQIVPSLVETATVDDQPVLKVVLYKGDTFIKGTSVVKNQELAFVLFYEFIFLGNRPKYIDYQRSAFMFDEVKKVCGVDFKTDRVVFEIISAHLYRDATDLMKPYRLTDMKSPPVAIALRAVAHAATSVSSKLIGSYFSANTNSVLVNKSEESSPIEDMLRL